MFIHQGNSEQREINQLEKSYDQLITFKIVIIEDFYKQSYRLCINTGEST